jgi:hypothetical protein
MPTGQSEVGRGGIEMGDMLVPGMKKRQLGRRLRRGIIPVRWKKVYMARWRRIYVVAY